MYRHICTKHRLVVSTEKKRKGVRLIFREDNEVAMRWQGYKVSH